MTATLTTSPEFTHRRELDHRYSNGIGVTLSWCPVGGKLYVTVVEDAGDSFELDVDPELAYDVFHHPYAYAGTRSAQLVDVLA